MSISSSDMRKRVLSGMRPTGKLHLGNYMGALYNWVRLQNEYECYFFIADWHALTTDYANVSKLPENTREVALDFLASGLDPEKSTIFVQSHVKQHAELHLLFSMITPLSWLERVPTYKDQQEQLKEKDLATYGFLGYPLLQSADILVYQPDFVPVGQDQVAHVELTREVARRFNYYYPGPDALHTPPQRPMGEGEKNLPVLRPILEEPKVLLTPSPKLPGTDGRKMSKSYGNTILLTDSSYRVSEKLRNMYNGGQRAVLTDPGDPNLCPVAQLHGVFSNPEINFQIRTGCETASISCLDCKRMAAESITTILRPIQEARSALELNPERVDDVLSDGAKRAALRAEKTMELVRDAMGLKRAPRYSLTAFEQIKEDVPGGLQHSLSNYEALWNESTTTRGGQLREYWKKNMLPGDIAVKPGDSRVFITSRNKRVFVPTAREHDGKYKFNARNKSYEAVVLLAWQAEDFILRAFVVPQKEYRAVWSKIPKSFKTFNLTLFKENNRYILEFPSTEKIDITRYEGDYSSLR